MKAQEIKREDQAAISGGYTVAPPRDPSADALTVRGDEQPGNTAASDTAMMPDMSAGDASSDTATY